MDGSERGELEVNGLVLMPQEMGGDYIAGREGEHAVCDGAVPVRLQ